MRGDLRCVEGTLYRHDPQWDDPDLETARGVCPDCNGKGCEETDDGYVDPWQRVIESKARYARLLDDCRRIVFDKGQSAASRISALQALLARPGDTNDLGVAI